MSDVCNGSRRELGACHPGPICWVVHPNHGIAPTKWEKLVLSVTNWPRATTTDRKRIWRRKRWRVGSDGGGGVNGEKDISFIDLCLVHKTDDFICSSTSESIKKRSFLWREREGREKTGSKCTPKQISKCGAQWPQRGDHPHRVGSVLYHPPPFTAVCTAALVKLKWVFPPWEAEHDMR